MDCEKKKGVERAAEAKAVRYRDDAAYRERCLAREAGRSAKLEKKPRVILNRDDFMVIRCSKCGKEKPRGQFYKKVRFGRRVSRKSWCKECERPYAAARNARRQERMRGRGSYSGLDVERLIVRQRGCCAICGCSLVVDGFHVDHVRPVSKGGFNTVDNLQILCGPCNLKKGDRWDGVSGWLW